MMLQAARGPSALTLASWRAAERAGRQACREARAAGEGEMSDSDGLLCF